MATNTRLDLADFNVPYSPLKGDTTTQEHVERHLAIGHALENGNYGSIRELVPRHPAPINAEAEDLEAFFSPLTKDWTKADWELFHGFGRTHDIGKQANPNSLIGQQQESLKARGLMTNGCHALAGVQFLEAHPEYLEDQFEQRDHGLVSALIHTHLNPGQIAFGEGHLGSYQKLFDLQKKHGHERAVEMALVQGLVDVAASGPLLIKPIIGNSNNIATNLMQAAREGRSANSQAYLMAANDLQTEEFGNQTVGVWRLFKATRDKGQNLDTWAESYKQASVLVGEDVAQYAVTAMGAERTILGSYVTPAFNNDTAKQGVDQPTRIGMLMQVYAATHDLAIFQGVNRHIPLAARTIGLATGHKENAARNIGQIVESMGKAPKTVSSLTGYLSNGSSPVLLCYDAGSVDAVWNGEN